jgi:hypothetical protein
MARGRYDLAFLVAGAIGLGVPVLAWRWPRAPRPRRTEQHALWRQFTGGLQEVIRERLVLVASLAQAAHFLPNGSLRAFVTDVAPRARYGAAHGVSGAICDIADAAGPLVAGLLVGAWGYATMFRAMATAATLTGLMFYWLSRPGAR